MGKFWNRKKGTYRRTGPILWFAKLFFVQSICPWYLFFQVRDNIFSATCLLKLQSKREKARLPIPFLNNKKSLATQPKSWPYLGPYIFSRSQTDTCFKSRIVGADWLAEYIMNISAKNLPMCDRPNTFRLPGLPSPSSSLFVPIAVI